jgi:glutamyl-tRNA synthetase
LDKQKELALAHGLSTHVHHACRDAPPDQSEERAHRGEAFAVKFKSSRTPVPIHDIVYGRYVKADPEEDFVLKKRDGYPTYHLANVVDDRLMKITHVIRGAVSCIAGPVRTTEKAADGFVGVAHLDTQAC